MVETSYRNKTLQIILLGGMAWFMLVVFSNHAVSVSQQYIISSNNADKLSVPLPPSTDGLIRKESATGGSSLPPQRPDPVKQMLGKSDNNLQLIQPKYCDNEKKYIENCNPTPTNCTKQITKVFSTHGIGNALMISYYKDASPVFESECIPILNDANEGRENGAFKLLDYVQVPNEYVCTKTDVGTAEQQCKSSTIHKKCVIYSISQPLPAVQKTIDTILLPEQQHLPLVAIHVRTGWADEMAVRKHVWDRFVNTSSVCSHEDVINYVHGDDGSGSSNNQTDDHDDDVADSLGKAIYDTGASGIDFSLDGFLDSVRDKANANYGIKQWRLFVASDAPAVKRYASNYLRGNYIGNEALMTKGFIVHNHNGASRRSHEENVRTNINLFADLIIMSESSLFGYTSSKYPGVAALRSQCNQETIQPRGHPRHDLAIVARIAGKFLPFINKVDYDDDGASLLYDELRRSLPKDASCLDSKRPVLACLCWIKRAHE